MARKYRLYLTLLILGTLVGVVVKNSHASGAFVRSGEIRVLRPDSSIAIQMGLSPEGSAGLWINPLKATGTIQMGLHGNGFPFTLVSDGAIRNFGLGRVDGKNASPILVFRSDDEVKMVFGLSMTTAGQPPFLTHYSSDGVKHDFIGSYCGNPNRVCTQ